MITDEIQSYHTKKPKAPLQLFNFKAVPKCELQKTKPASSPLHQTCRDVSRAAGESGLLAFQQRLDQQKRSPTQSQSISVAVDGARPTEKVCADVEMLSATEVLKGSSKVIVVDAQHKASPADVEMLSAKGKVDTALSRQQEVPAPEPSGSGATQTVAPPMDTKALIKAALLRSRRRIQTGESRQRCFYVNM